MEVPTIYKALYMVLTYLHLLDPEMTIDMWMKMTIYSGFTH